MISVTFLWGLPDVPQPRWPTKPSFWAISARVGGMPVSFIFP